jgi:hypothetical protein
VLTIVGITNKYIEVIYYHADVADLTLQEYQLRALWAFSVKLRCVGLLGRQERRERLPSG